MKQMEKQNLYLHKSNINISQYSTICYLYVNTAKVQKVSVPTKRFQNNNRY